MFCLDETKLDDSFRDSQFVLEHFQFPSFHRDQNSKGGGKLVYVKQGIIAKRLENLETNFSVTVCIELTISKKKWNSQLLLTNKPKSFQKTFVCETGLSGCHKLVATIFRSTFIKSPPKVVKYRSYKNFDENKFCRDLDQILVKGDM